MQGYGWMNIADVEETHSRKDFEGYDPDPSAQASCPDRMGPLLLSISSADSRSSHYFTFLWGGVLGGDSTLSPAPQIA